MSRRGLRASTACSSSCSSSCSPRQRDSVLPHRCTQINDPNNQNDILYFFAQQISGTPVAYLMVLAVLSSTVATTQTTLLPSSRLTYSMSRDGVFPKAFGTVHKSWKTPWVGTIISSVLAIVVIALTVVIDNVGSVFANLILDIGVLVALYYGITGIACAWAFRKVLLTSVTRFIFAGVLPFVGGIYLILIAYALVAPDVVAVRPVDRLGHEPADHHHDPARDTAGDHRRGDRAIGVLPREDRVVRVAATASSWRRSAAHRTMELRRRSGAALARLAAVAPLRTDRATSNTRRRVGGTRGAPGTAGSAESGDPQRPVGHPWRSTRRRAFPSSCPARHRCRSSPSRR